MRKKRKLRQKSPIKVPFPETTDKIGKVEKMLGFDRVHVRFPDDSLMLCRIRGKLKKRVWIKPKDIVLVSPWDFEPTKGDIFYRYTRDQVKVLVRKGLISRNFWKGIQEKDQNARR